VIEIMLFPLQKARAVNHSVAHNVMLFPRARSEASSAAQLGDR
jgi:hypothetical protein